MNILFLGDSITDCGHCFTEDNLGNGYVKFVAEAYGNCTVQNGGTDGFTLPRILQKWERMYRGTYHDIAVILGGINDVAVATDTGLTSGQAARYLEQSETALRELLNELILDGTKHVFVIEPFLFEKPDWLLQWRPCLEEMRIRIRHAVPADTRISLLSVQASLDELVHKLGLSAVSPDGIHLTRIGHRCIADLLIYNIERYDRR